MPSIGNIGSFDVDHTSDNSTYACTRRLLRRAHVSWGVGFSVSRNTKNPWNNHGQEQKKKRKDKKIGNVGGCD